MSKRIFQLPAMAAPAPDDSTIFLPLSVGGVTKRVAWDWLTNRRIQATWYGDDIQAAIDASAAQGGGIVELTAYKRYVVSSGSVIVHGNGVRLECPGFSCQIVNQSAAGVTVQFGDNARPANACGIKGVNFIPSVTRNSSAYEIYVANASNTNLEDLEFNGVWGCIKLGSAAAAQAMCSISIRRALNFHQLLYACRFISIRASFGAADSQQTDAIGLILDGGVEGSEFYFHDITGGGAIGLWTRKVDYAGSPPQYLNFFGGFFDGHDKPFLGDAGYDIEFHGTWFSASNDLTGLSGVTLNAGISNIRFLGGRSFGCTQHGMDINGATDVLTVGMFFGLNIGDGIHVRAGQTGRVRHIAPISTGNLNSGIFIDTSCSNILIDQPSLSGNVADITNGSPDTTLIITFDSSSRTVNGITASTKGYRAPASAGTALFAMDLAAEGFVTVANNATITPFGNANNFSGMFIVATTYDGCCAVFVTGGNGMVKMGGTTSSIGTTANNAGTINVYVSGTVITIQNKTGGSVQVKVAAVPRMRQGQ